MEYTGKRRNFKKTIFITKYEVHKMNEVEFPHEEGDDEVHFRDDDPQTETTPPTPITSHDMDVIIKG